jgi:hypothetical protein
MKYFLAFLVLALVPPALAAELPGRYALEKVPSGYLRIDKQTGAIARCRVERGVWTCSDLAESCCQRTGLNCTSAERNENVARAFKLFAGWLDRFVLFTRSVTG